MKRDHIEQAMARDLRVCDLMEAIGSERARRRATKQRQIIYAQIKRWNALDGLDTLSDDELLDALDGITALPQTN